MVHYLSEQKLIALNGLLLACKRVKKRDKAMVLSHTKLTEALKECEETEGDIFDKAVTLLAGLVQVHAFASGNRRTAVMATWHFIRINNAKVIKLDERSISNVLQGIREEYYSKSEVKEWIKNGKIKRFKR